MGRRRWIRPNSRAATRKAAGMGPRSPLHRVARAHAIRTPGRPAIGRRRAMRPDRTRGRRPRTRTGSLAPIGDGPIWPGEMDRAAAPIGGRDQPASAATAARRPRSTWAATACGAAGGRGVMKVARAMAAPPTHSSGPPTRATRLPGAAQVRAAGRDEARPTPPASAPDSAAHRQPARWGKARLRPLHRLARQGPIRREAADPPAYSARMRLRGRARPGPRPAGPARISRAEGSSRRVASGSRAGRTDHRPATAPVAVRRAREPGTARVRTSPMAIRCPPWNRPRTVRCHLARSCPAARQSPVALAEPEQVDRDRDHPLLEARRRQARRYPAARRLRVASADPQQGNRDRARMGWEAPV